MSPDDPHCRQELRDVVKHAVSEIGDRAFGGESLENAGVYFVFIGAPTIEVSSSVILMTIFDLLWGLILSERTLKSVVQWWLRNSPNTLS